jgi:hypothetical protein
MVLMIAQDRELYTLKLNFVLIKFNIKFHDYKEIDK